MHCARCSKAAMVEIRMQVGERDLTFRRCGQCEAQSWETTDGPRAPRARARTRTRPLNLRPAGRGPRVAPLPPGMLAGWCTRPTRSTRPGAPTTATSTTGTRRVRRPRLPRRRRASGSTAWSTGSASRSSPRAASTCSCSSARGCCSSTPRRPAATPARTCGSPRTCATTCCRGGSRAGRPTTTPVSRPGSSTSRSRRC